MACCQCFSQIDKLVLEAAINAITPKGLSLLLPDEFHRQRDTHHTNIHIAEHIQIGQACPPARSTYAYKITYTHAYNIIRSQSKSYHMQPTLNAETTNPYHSIHTTLIHARLNKCTQLAPYRSVQIGHVWTSLMGLPRGFNLSSCSARTAYTGTPQIKRTN